MRPLGAACAHAPHTHFHIQVNTLTQHINISPFLLYSLWSTIFKSCFSKSNQILVKSLKPSITLNSKTKSHIKRSRHHDHLNSIHCYCMSSSWYWYCHISPTLIWCFSSVSYPTNYTPLTLINWPHFSLLTSL